MQTLGPHLSETSVHAVTASARWWQIACILDDKLQRAVRCLPGAQVGSADARVERSTAKLADDLGNDFAALLGDMHPRWLVFQVRSAWVVMPCGRQGWSSGGRGACFRCVARSAQIAPIIGACASASVLHDG